MTAAPRPDRTAPATRAGRVALATCAEEPGLDGEGRLLLAALSDAGVEAGPAVWDDPGQDWSGYDLVVVRSTWDYARRLPAYLAWADEVAAATRLLNDPALLRWTTDKSYLEDLARRGVPVVPSVFLPPGSDPAHPLLDVEHVVKPTVSAGSLDTLRLGAGEVERSTDHVRAIHASGRTALVQPYLASVDERGETAVVHVDGVLSHAIRKGALLEAGAGLVDGLFAQEQIEPREPSRAELDVARACLGLLPPTADGAPPLYARVDLLAGEDGPLVLEVELAEPSLFLEHADGAAERLAAAIAARL